VGVVQLTNMIGAIKNPHQCEKDVSMSSSHGKMIALGLFYHNKEGFDERCARAGPEIWLTIHEDGHT
jgi:hypothetical protein